MTPDVRHLHGRGQRATGPGVRHEAFLRPLGLLQLVSKAANADTRRILTIMIRVIESLGKDLRSERP